MKFLTITTLFAALAAASPIVENVERGNLPEPQSVKVKSVTYSGSGCPQGSVDGPHIEQDGTVVSLGFDKYTAQTGGNAAPKDARKNCNVRMNLQYPAGWSYTVATTQLRGYAKVPKSCKASLGAKYFWSGFREDAKCEANFKGPIDRDYTEETAASALIWSQCGANGKDGPAFNINTEGKIDCKDEATLSVDTQDTSFNMKFHLQWKRC